MEIKQSIVHILDCEYNTFIPSQTCMMNMNEELLHIFEKKINKAFENEKKTHAVFQDGSIIKNLLESYKEASITFEEFSEKTAKHMFDMKMKSGLFESSDVMIGRFINEGRNYLFILDNAYQKGVTHQLKQEERVENELLIYRTLLSSGFTTKDRAVFIEISDNSMYCVETKIDINAQKCNFMAQFVMQSIPEISYKEAVQMIVKTAEQVKSKYDIREIDLLPKMKGIINDSIEKQEKIDVNSIADVLFDEKPLAKAEFNDTLKNQGVHKPIDTENMKAKKSEKYQKIKTDNGIELNIPVDYMSSNEYVEFNTQADGTISIQLKNISHITSK